MTFPFAARVFALSFLPVAALLVGGFWSIQYEIGQTVRDGLRATLRQNHDIVSRLRDGYESRNRRLLTVLAENPSLKAGFDLVRLEPGNREALLTLQDQLRELTATLGFDMLAATDAGDDLLTGVVWEDGLISPIDSHRLPDLAAGAMPFGDQIYLLTRIPVNLGVESLGNLYAGHVFDLSEFSGPTVLSFNGEVLRSNVPGVTGGQLQQSLATCQPSEECEVTIGAETLLCLPLRGAGLGPGYLLHSLRSIDSASRPLRETVGSVFLATGAIALLAISLVSLISAKSVAKPLTGLVTKLRESEDSGVLPSFEATSSTREVNQLIEAFNHAAASISDARSRLGVAYREFTQSLSSAIDARDVYTAGHSRRVAAYAVAIAEEMNLSRKEVEAIREGALLHDVGKIGISDIILQKPGGLTHEEFELIRRHPLIGRRIIERVEGLAPYLSIVELHHENHDGSGYPWKLAGAEIPLDARIVHVADTYDAVTSDRPYRKGKTPAQALEILQKYAGTQFDPEVVEAFSRVHAGLTEQETVAGTAHDSTDLDVLRRALGSQGEFSDAAEFAPSGPATSTGTFPRSGYAQATKGEQS